MGLIEEILEAQARRRARPARKPWATADSKPLTNAEVDEKYDKIEALLGEIFKHCPKLEALLMLRFCVHSVHASIGRLLFQQMTATELDDFEKLNSDLARMKAEIDIKMKLRWEAGERIDWDLFEELAKSLGVSEEAR